MRSVFVLFLVAACATASAEIFKKVNPDGSVSFSDTPTTGAEQVEVAPANSITLPPVPSRVTGSLTPAAGSEDPQKDNFSYEKLAIVEPADQQGIRANDGSVTVSLDLRPGLASGHSVELAVSGEDGEKVYTGTALQFRLNQLSRGRHTVTARVRDVKGQKLKESLPVSFYVLRVGGGG